MKTLSTCCLTQTTNIFRNCAGSIRGFLLLLFFVTAIQFGVKAQTPPPACNVVGPLTACAEHDPSDIDDDIVIYIEVARSTPNSTISYSFVSNSAGAFIRQDLHGVIINPHGTTLGITQAQGTGVYNVATNTTYDTLILYPGIHGYDFDLQVNDTTKLGGLNTCECSKSVSVSDIYINTSAPPIHCYGGTTTLTVAGYGASANGYGITNYFDTLYVGREGENGPPGTPGTPNPNHGSATFAGIAAGTYSVFVMAEVDACDVDTTITITQPAYNPVVLNCPSDLTVASCQTQASVNGEFATWLATVTTSGGTNPVLSNNNTGAPLACGGSTTVTFSVRSDCQDTLTTCRATFTVTPAPVVSLTGPSSLTVASCQTQAAVNSEFADWLATATSSGGCKPIFTNNSTGAPLACGGSTTVIFTVTSDCDQPHTASATFTVPAAPVVSLTGPSPLTVASCQTQAAVNTEFVTWLATATTRGGCNPIFTNNNTGAPLACGGSATVTFTVTSDCDQPHTASATFTVPAAPVVSLTGPSPLTVASCQTQAAVNTEFATWLATATTSGGCNPVFTNNNTGAPLACGGSTTVIFTVTSGCDQPHTASATFTVPAAPVVSLTGPSPLTVASCQTQAAVNTEFVTWLATATTRGGCNPIFTNNNTGAPLACGGSTTVIFTVTSDCDQPHTASATFTVPTATPVSFTCAQDLTVNACQDQAAVNSEFAAWLATATASGGCNGHLSNNSEGVPAACGGSTTVTFTYSSDCDAPHICSATFTVNYPAPIALTCAQNLRVNACQSQGDVNSEFAAWLATASGTGGCHGQLSYGQPTPPSACGGRTAVTFAYTATGYMKSGNRIINGDFSQKYTAFNSDYHYVSPADNAASGGLGLWPEGYFAVDSDASVYHPAFEGHDHTSGNGAFFMIINGSGVPNTEVWSQFVNGIIPNTDYQFSTWVTSVNPESQALLNFSINGVIIGNEFHAPATVGSWIEFQTTWNSGSNTTADISIVNQNTVLGGNDFGLDDISFAPTSGACNPVTDTCRATFTVPAAPTATLTAARDLTVNSCQTQDAVNTEFAAWLATASVSGGCSPQLNNNSTTAPAACGGSVTVNFTVNDYCLASPITASATFTVPAAPVVSLTGPSLLTVASCQTQAAVNTEFANWLATATTSGGCNPVFTNNNTGAPLACGGSTTVIFTVTSGCDQPHTASATFTVPAAPVVSLTGPSSLTVASCQTQAAVNTEFVTWLATATTRGGCNPIFTNNNTGAPLACGGSTTVTFTLTSDCDQPHTASATFTVPAAPVVSLTGPSPLTVASCQTQAAVNTEFAAWLATATTQGGCNPIFTNNNTGAPLACGGSTTVTFTLTSDCDQPHTASATFTVPAAPVVSLTGPSPLTVASCQTQAAVNTEFATWLATATTSGGCNPVFTNNNTGAPLVCGGSTTVIFTVTSGCDQPHTASAIFTVPAAPVVSLTGPSSLTVASCQTQAAVNTEFATWLATATTLGGCNPIFTNNNTGAPSACGGSTTVTFTLTSDCDQPHTASATFTVPATVVALTGPSPLTVASCQTQAAVNTEFATWLASATTSGGCNPVFTNNNTGAPLACGGSTTVIFTVTSDCDQPHTASATFTVTAAPVSSLAGVSNLTVASCQTQAAVNAEFTAWLATATASGGCNPVFSNNNTGAPLACGGTTTVTFTVTSDCDQPHTASATFTVPAAPPVSLTIPADLTIASGQTQAAIDAAFAAWLATAHVSGGCNTILFNSSCNVTIPSCGGSIKITFVATSDCDVCNSGSATFTVPGGGGGHLSMGPCSHTDLTCNSSCHHEGGSSGGSVSAGTITGASGTVSYVWKNSSNVIVGTTATVNGLPTGTYTLTVSDNCSTLTCTQIISQPSAMIMGACSHTDLTCNSGCNHGGSGHSGSVSAGTITNVQGHVSYVWKNSLNVVVGTTPTVTGLPAGTYTLTVSDNCSELTCSQTISEPTAMTMAACSHTDATCNSSTGSVTAGAISNATGPVTYRWENSSHHVVGTTATVTGLPAGTYTLTVSDNCSDLTCSQTILADEGTISCSINSLPSGGCSSTGGNPEIIYLGYGPQSTHLSASVTGTGPFTYSWSPSANLSCSNCSSPLFTPTVAGSYTFTVTVRSSSGECTSTCDITICVLDIRVPAGHCGGLGFGSKVYLCQNSFYGGAQTIIVSVGDVAQYLSRHSNDHLGSCSQSCSTIKDLMSENNEPTLVGNETNSDFDVLVYPNPFTSQFHLMIQTESTERIDMSMLNITGQLITQTNDIQTNTDLMLGDQLSQGVYFIEVRQGDIRKVLRIVKAD